jgi:hypothetical protein
MVVSQHHLSLMCVLTVEYFLNYKQSYQILDSTVTELPKACIDILLKI